MKNESEVSFLFPSAPLRLCVILFSKERMMRLSERALKDQLYDIAENDFKLPEHADPLQRALEMMPHIGSLDSELRDDLIYTTLAKWIMNNLFTGTQLKELLTIATDEEHLTAKLGEKKTDSIFTRSFSMLLIPPALFVHRRNPFLAADEIKELKQQVLDYLVQEQDLRGFLVEEDKGWAHAVAHTADALDELAQCQELEAADLLEILEAIQIKVAVPETVYHHEEDERLVFPVMAVLGRKLLRESDIKEWLHGFVTLAKEEEPFPDCYYQAINVKNFLRSLYFRARKPETAAAIGEASANTLADFVAETLREIGRF
jgi:hypothetical protein